MWGDGGAVHKLCDVLPPAGAVGWAQACASRCTFSSFPIVLRDPPPPPPRAPVQDQDTGIRVGDVFALMIEYWYEQRNAAQAYKLVEQMRSRNIILSPYLDQRMLEDIYKVGVCGGGGRAATRGAC